MKIYTCTILFTLLLATVFLGCETQNPVCTKSYCFVGEAFERSELDTSKPYSEIDISEAKFGIDEATILEALADIKHVEPELDPKTLDRRIRKAPTVPIEKIVLDVSRGRTYYQDRTVKTRITVDGTDDKYVVVLSNNPNVNFFLLSPDNPQWIDLLEFSKTYDLTLSIFHIRDNRDRTYTIWADLETEPVFVDVPIEEVRLWNVVRDVAEGINTYRGKTIKVEATVEYDLTAFFRLDVITLETRNRRVEWYVSDTTEDRFDSVRKGDTYTFTLYVHKLASPNPESGSDVHIINTFVLDIE